MRLRCTAALDFVAPDAGCQLIAKLEVADGPGHAIVSESLTAGAGTVLHPGVEPLTGARLRRASVAGPVQLRYAATVEVAPRLPIPADATRDAWLALPPEVLHYLQPSRFCPSDQFLRFTAREFGELDGGARINAILDWIDGHVDYVHGVSTAATTAAETFTDRAGVCRDFTHLGIALCRAAGVPARAVAAYALDLEPPDFHAVLEVWLAGGWWLVDPTRLAPIDGLVRIAHGRDAADIAFLTSDATLNEVSVCVAVTRAPA